MSATKEQAEQAEQATKLVEAYNDAVTSEEIMTTGFALLAFLGEAAKRALFDDDVTDKMEFVSASEMLITTYQKLPNICQTLVNTFPIFLSKRHLGLEGASDAEAKLALRQMMKADMEPIAENPQNNELYL